MIINELASTNLTSTVAFGFAHGAPGRPAPYSFAAAMGDDSEEFFALVALKCAPGVSDKICNFDAVKPPSALPPSEDETPQILPPMDLVEPNYAHGVCNMKSGKCDECDPGSSGTGCVSTASCEADCKEHPAKDYGYDCDQDGFRCEQSVNGTFSKDECSDRCTKAAFAFGKCDFRKGKCQECKRSPDDPDCLYPMDYCKKIEASGGCQGQTLKGIHRGIIVDVHR